MKKKGWIVVIAVLLAGAALFLSTPKQRTMRYFYRYRSELEAGIARYQAGEPLSYPSKPGLSVNIWDGDHEIIEYMVASWGTAPSSTYCGIFYSLDNVPVSFQNSGIELSRKGQYEWTWQGEGNNRGYVELIRPHWYYFEASL